MFGVHGLVDRRTRVSARSSLLVVSLRTSDPTRDPIRHGQGGLSRAATCARRIDRVARGRTTGIENGRNHLPSAKTSACRRYIGATDLIGVGKRGWGSFPAMPEDRTPSHPADAAPADVPFGPELGHRTVTHACITTFGCLTGDHARMHFDRSFASGSEGRGTIAHGLLSAAWSLGALTLHAPERLGVGDPAASLAGYSIRFRRPVHEGDRFALRLRETNRMATEGLGAGSGPHTDFELVDQRGEVTCSGRVSVARDELGAPSPPPLLEIGSPRRPPAADILYADDMLERGPRGESLGRTLGEADVVAWTGFTGELDPAYLNAEFAARRRAGGRIVPPMLVFCLGFGDFLRDLLRFRMPDSGFAGHVGDAWRQLAPVRPGDTIRTRYAAVSVTPTRSRPGRAIVEFALQSLDQRDSIVQDGRVAMMMSVRPR